MAQVDFSNANITPINNYHPMVYKYMGLINYNYTGWNDQTVFYKVDRSAEVANPVSVVITGDTASRYSISFTGTFTASGTGFVWVTAVDGNNSLCIWKIDGISFSAGDTFDFIIDVDVTGS